MREVSGRPDRELGRLDAWKSKEWRGKTNLAPQVRDPLPNVKDCGCDFQDVTSVHTHTHTNPARRGEEKREGEGQRDLRRRPNPTPRDVGVGVGG